jgi:hypothetical protein
LPFGWVACHPNGRGGGGARLSCRHQAEAVRCRWGWGWRLRSTEGDLSGTMPLWVMVTSDPVAVAVHGRVMGRGRSQLARAGPITCWRMNSSTNSQRGSCGIVSNIRLRGVGSNRMAVGPSVRWCLFHAPLDARCVCNGRAVNSGARGRVSARASRASSRSLRQSEQPPRGRQLVGRAVLLSCHSRRALRMQRTRSRLGSSRAYSARASRARSRLFT